MPRDKKKKEKFSQLTIAERDQLMSEICNALKAQDFITAAIRTVLDKLLTELAEKDVIQHPQEQLKDIMEELKKNDKIN